MMSKSQKRKTGTQVGVISDTHGVLRPQAVDALAGSDLILHAGDIGKPEVLEGLRAIAPVIAVRGNVDCGAWADGIPERQTVNIETVAVHLLHIVQELTVDLKTSGIQVVISGHSHKPVVEERDGILFLNPGSAGPRRFKLPIAVAQVHIADGDVQAQIIELAV